MKLANPDDYKNKLRAIRSDKFIDIVKDAVSEADTVYHSMYGITEKYRLTKEWCDLLYKELFTARINNILV